MFRVVHCDVGNTIEKLETTKCAGHNGTFVSLSLTYGRTVYSHLKTSVCISNKVIFQIS